MNFKVNKNLFLALFCILTAFFVLYDMVYGVWDHDGGYYLLKSKLISQGYFPFADFQFVYFPLFIFISSLFFKLPVSDLVLVFLIPFTWTISNAALTYKIAILKTESVSFGLVSTIIFFVFCIENGNNHLTLEQGIVFFTLIIFYLEEMKKPNAIPAIAGAVILNKQIGIVSLLYALFVSYSANRKIMRGMRSYCIWGIVSLVLLFGMAKFDFQAIKFHLFDEFYLNVNAVEPFSLKFILNEFRRSLFSFLFLICNVLIFCFLFFNLPGSRLNLALVFCSILLYVSVRGVRDYPHYSLNSWPFSLLLLIYFFNYARNLKMLKYHKMAVLVLIGSFFYQNGKEFLNGRSKWSYGSSVLEFFVPLAEEIKKRSLSNEKILALGQDNIIEYLADRMPQDFKLPWYKPYNAIELTSNLVVIFNDSYPGSKEMHVRLQKEGFRLVYRKSFLIFPEPLGYVYVRDR